MNVSRMFSIAAAAAGLFVLSSTANAIILLSPGTSGVIAGDGYGPSNCEPTCVETVFDVTELSLFYKDNVGGSEEGAFADFYSTLFWGSDPSASLTFYTGGPAITCGGCYLAIKDGNHSPGYYFYDLSAWNGTESIILHDFWPRKGAISHISIWGGSGSTSVPEPATLGLLGLGLFFAGFAKRKKHV